ncbi:hypothetical protein FOQG_19155 [Fusarium oxysporum f. sp. raphani 54005]|uniref:Uncharacterized protein n=1 Tax=Fusarium oxysporum f. sp. raphani 54005 TaxID=1089458 RepID=X0B1T1_FUSOX|nr:hypothetical protein FOQG_19155 [Fusarium oxysporum f. sp. raphani 54005]
MNQNRSGQPSPSNNGPECPSDIGSARTAAPPVLEVIFEDPQLRRETAVRAEPSRELPKHFVSLVRDMSQENGQLKKRREQGLDDPRKVWDQLAKLEKLDLTRYPQQRATLEPWHELVIIAATMVDEHLGNKDIALSTITQLNRRELSHETINRDKRVIREMIKLMDDLYLQWKHELALEIFILLDIPMSVLRLQSAQKFNALTLQLKNHTPSTKIKSFLKLYIPFLVLLLRPKYRLSDIQKALQTSLFNQADWDTFREALQRPAPKYDPIRDIWTNHRPVPSVQAPAPEAPEPQQRISTPIVNERNAPTSNLELSEFIDYKRNYPAKIHTPISGFKAFETSPDLQRKVAYASENQTGYTPTGPDLFAYDWADDIHGPVMRQVLEDLAKYGFLQAEEVYVARVSVSHGLTSTIVPAGHLQIVVPIEDSHWPVSLSNQESSTTVKWNTGIMYTLDQKTKLSASGWIKYMSLLAVT